MAERRMFVDGARGRRGANLIEAVIVVAVLGLLVVVGLKLV